MNLVLTRKWREGDATIGEIAVDGGFECYSLEDRVHDGPKIPGQTAIPTGAYGIVLHTSAALRMEVPMLCDVPDFEWIYLHPGNTPSDTKGCILVGRGRDVAAITESRIAYMALFSKIKAAMLDGEAVRIEIVDAFEDAA